ncbi:MAG: hypothetical protein E7Z84_08195 [Methanosphaera stadtmanae]|nr:hypothetical protein [Methanosphaera stadtmanae]
MNLNFILPLQTPGTTMVDGSVIIVIGAIIVAYYVYKHLKNRNDNHVGAMVENQNSNVLENKFEQRNTDFVRPKTTNIYHKSVNHQKQEVHEEEIPVEEKQVVINQRNN